MAAVVDSYACEWRQTLGDPARLRQFRHFVNSDRSDDNLFFVSDRNQIRPATAEEKRQLERIV